MHLDAETWKQNMSNLREFTWSGRVIQWLPLAGALAVARRSVPAAGLLLGWLLGYVVLKGSASVATIESGSFWRLVMPGLPAFALLAAAIPLLVPTFVGRLGTHLAPMPPRRPDLRLTAALVVVLGAVPIVVLLTSTPKQDEANPTPPPPYLSDTLIVDFNAVPADPSVVSLDVRRTADGNELVWTDSTRRAETFYRVYRASPSGGFPDMVCEPRSVDQCELRAETLDTTRERRYLDPDPPPDADVPDRRRRELARRDRPRRRVRDQSAGRSVVAAVAGAASSASRRARRSATSCARSTLSSVSRESTVE